MNEVVFQELFKFGVEFIFVFCIVSVFVMEDSICNWYFNFFNGYVIGVYKKVCWIIFIFVYVDFVGLGCIVFIFWYGGCFFVVREYDVIVFLVIYMVMIQGVELVGQWFFFGFNVVQVVVVVNRILQVRDSKIKDFIFVVEQIFDMEGGIVIELRDVFFKYFMRDVFIFWGLNIMIEKGQFVVFVGVFGLGKMLIVLLLEWFYDVDKGQILFNGKDIFEVNVFEYWKLLLFVVQELLFFYGMIRENIFLGVDLEQVSEEELYNCCKDVSIYEFIMSLFEGYNMNIGSRGVSLLGGQKQRLSIVRVLIRNLRVLLLDEVISLLDLESEKLVQKVFERVVKGRMMVVVVYWLVMIQGVDVIYVLGEGKVLEKGNYNELLRKKGVYWYMVSLFCF